MSTIDDLRQAMVDWVEDRSKSQAAREEYDAYVAQYGTRAQRDSAYNRSSNADERAEIVAQNREGYRLLQQYRTLKSRTKESVHRLNAIIATLPGGSQPLPERTVKMGSIENFRIEGEITLMAGNYVDYETDGGMASAIFDDSGKLVAYHLGDENWTVIEKNWQKYAASVDYDTGLSQTDIYIGTVGERDQKKKVHIAVNELGDIIFVRDFDGEVLYDRKNGIGALPPDLNWDR